ncbi:DNA repair helicase XPB [Cohnella candidum]|uniref:DNA repair helicase XPB n=1 Tax=Cohnella candidum TaxID=2674991 RepID=UPI0019D16463|nr:DNA repair helicase XPB [Cohnella candidum]
MSSSLPLWVQSDGTLLLDARHPLCEEALNALRPIAELTKRPGHLHTYRMTPVSLWNAAANGENADSVVEKLRRVARFGIPVSVEREIRERMGSFGRFRLRSGPEGLYLTSDVPDRLRMAFEWPDAAECFDSSPENSEIRVAVKPDRRGALKSALAARGCPVVDEAGFRSGGSLAVGFKEINADGQSVSLRSYQREALDAFLGPDRNGGGSGVAVLPCGAGKTWVGMAALAALGCETLILTPNAMSVTQWIRELLRNTTLGEEEVGEYTGSSKQVRPVTVATYQVLTYRRSKTGGHPHWKLFEDRDWGLIIYDEVHLLPAPVFRMTADLQATRRLGLTATLVREDGRETDVFALIGPKRYELAWKRGEREGWIAEAACHEIRVPLPEPAARQYREAPPRSRHRIAGENPAKAEVVRGLLVRHAGMPTIVIGQYLNQLRRLAAELGLPLVTGSMPQEERKKLFDRFNRGEIGTLLVSKVANFAVDLPDAAVAIQVSGSYGSRQEEAQRLGRVLRPKKSGSAASFYTLVSEETDEVEFSRNRGRFLVEQGYAYSVDVWEAAGVSGAEGAAT